jgi:uroporphyrinogen-III synthase
MTAKTSTKIDKNRRPLSGLRVLIGRARHQASVLSADLRRRGAKVIEIPFIEIRKPRSYRPLDTALKNISSYDWLILTSVNGVDAFWKRLRKLHLTRRHLDHLQVAAIGPSTRKAAEKRGLNVDVVPKEYVAESVVERLRRRVKGKRILLARAKIARDVIPVELRKLGAHVDVVEAYETAMPLSSRSRLNAVLKNPKRRPDVITFTSSSSGLNFVTLVAGKAAQGRKATGYVSKLRGVKLASIGPVTSATLRQLGLPVDIEAREYTIPGLVKAIVADSKRQS